MPVEGTIKASLEVGFHGIVAALLGPVALQMGRHRDAGSAAHGLGKALYIDRFLSLKAYR